MRIFGIFFGLTFTLPAFANETMVMVEDVQSIRFVGEEIEGPFFSAGGRVTVLSREGDWARIRRGEDFGWVESSKLKENVPKEVEAPAPAE